MTQLCLIESKWLDAAEIQVCESIPSGSQFTSDELHALYGITEPMQRNLWGVLLARLKSRGLVQNMKQYKVSTRPEANGRPVAVWRRV